GDCALPDPASLWLLRDESRRRYLESVRYGDADGARAMLRSPTSLTATDNTGSAYGLSMGIDAASLVPPFFPVLTGEDFLFARMSMRADFDAVLAHLPIIVEHRAPEARAFSRNAGILSGGATHTTTVMAALLPVVAPQAPFDDSRTHQLRVSHGL